MRTEAYRLDSIAVRKELLAFAGKDRGSLPSDGFVRRYYTSGGPFHWLGRWGLCVEVDSLLSEVRQMCDDGFSPAVFRTGQLEDDLRHLSDLDFDEDHYTINRVYARLEYNLTRTYLRYVEGQRFGFVNPHRLFNRLDVRDSDSVRVTYRTLFDIPLSRGGEQFYGEAFRQLQNDSMAAFIGASQPRGRLYAVLAGQLRKNTDPGKRAKLLCNMERCRWRLKDAPQDYDKYVLVNLPAYRLWAVDKDSVLSMRIGCGTQKTKTPLLTSRISRMDVNPQWIIPQSIVEKDIVRHLGDEAYFARHHYFIRNRHTGQRLPLEQVSASMLLSRDCHVVQEGGAGNSLGRIIFRFANNFSVFLHDTSHPGVFERENRDVSHGCVRVQKPFELASFMLADKSDGILDKIRYSMSADVSSIGAGAKDSPESAATGEPLDRSRLVGVVPVTPSVPLFITYYTQYLDPQGQLVDYNDVYGYDRVLYGQLSQFMK